MTPKATPRTVAIAGGGALAALTALLAVAVSGSEGREPRAGGGGSERTLRKLLTSKKDAAFAEKVLRGLPDDATRASRVARLIESIQRWKGSNPVPPHVYRIAKQG